MGTKTIDKIIKTIQEIPENKHPELFEIVKEFKKVSRKSKKTGKWSRFAGILTDEEANIMLAAIEEEFEKIEED